MRSCSPEVGHRSSDRRVILVGMSIDISSVGNFALGCRIDAVDLGTCEALEGRETKSCSEGIDTSMLEKLITSLVDNRCIGVAF